MTRQRPGANIDRARAVVDEFRHDPKGVLLDLARNEHGEVWALGVPDSVADLNTRRQAIVRLHRTEHVTEGTAPGHRLMPRVRGLV